MPADMVAVLQQVHLRLVERGILLEAFNPFFDGAAKPRADLETFAGCTVGHHGWLLGKKNPAPKNNFFCGLKYFLPLPMLEKTHFSRQITL
jgi:hypothetical protein